MNLITWQVHKLMDYIYLLFVLCKRTVLDVINLSQIKKTVAELSSEEQYNSEAINFEGNTLSLLPLPSSKRRYWP